MQFPLPKLEWMQRREIHRQRVTQWTLPHRERRLRHEPHPINDFLFDYYSFRPSLLERWSPGWSLPLEGATVADFPASEGWIETDQGLALSLQRFPQHRLDSFRWMIQLLKITLDRPPQFACYGLHEWAMVYKIAQTRYPTVPLRMTPSALTAFIESQTICCTHHDAFRFYTPEAKPLNRHQPTKANRLDLEQSGCIHVTMDLYKWAHKFYPWTPSDLILEAFELAIESRQIDMKASPYDLSQWGLTPIKIETGEGKSEYVEEQRKIHLRGIPIRQKLLNFYQTMNQAIDSNDGFGRA